MGLGLDAHESRGYIYIFPTSFFNTFLSFISNFLSSFEFLFFLFYSGFCFRFLFLFSFSFPVLTFTAKLGIFYVGTIYERFQFFVYNFFSKIDPIFWKIWWQKKTKFVYPKTLPYLITRFTHFLFKNTCFTHFLSKNTCYTHFLFKNTCFTHFLFKNSCFTHFLFKNTCFTHFLFKNTCFTLFLSNRSFKKTVQSFSERSEAWPRVARVYGQLSKTGVWAKKSIPPTHPPTQQKIHADPVYFPQIYEPT